VSVTAANLVQGPATIYVGDFGATEPLDSEVSTTPSATYWTDAGGTLGGVKLKIDQKYSDLEVDQLVEVVESRLVSREIAAETKLAEVTLTNLRALMNGGTTGSGSGYETLDLLEGSSATQPDYSALIIDGYAPSGYRRRVILRKVLSVDSVEVEYQKKDQTVFSASFKAHYVSSLVKSMHIVDEVAAGS
jgi:hypothetical protein